MFFSAFSVFVTCKLNDSAGFHAIDDVFVRKRHTTVCSLLTSPGSDND